MTGLMLVHAAATWAMVGLIWFVQVVHYPLMAQVGPDRFVAYERAHQRRTGWLVGPLMLVEMATALALAAWPPAAMPRALAWAGVILLAGLWASTGLVQVPLHRRLETGFDPAVHRRLIVTNTARTAAWSLRGLIALWMLLETL